MLEETTAIFGDLVRAHRADTLMLLRDEKLRGRADALLVKPFLPDVLVATARRLASIPAS